MGYNHITITKALLCTNTISGIFHISNLLHNCFLTSYFDFDLNRMYLFHSNIDSWSTNTKQLTKPIIKYENYQLQCLLPNQKIIYDSSFTDDNSDKSYLSVVSVGTDQSAYSISVNTFSNILECTVVTYNRILLNVKNILKLKDNYEFTVMLPFTFSQTTSSTLFLNQITQKGKI